MPGVFTPIATAKEQQHHHHHQQLDHLNQPQPHFSSSTSSIGATSMSSSEHHYHPGSQAAAVERARKMQDYETLTQIINQWNANRLDLFALSLPNQVGLKRGKKD